MKFLRRNWAIVLACLLIPLVLLLAFLQIQWIRDMGERERLRLRQGLLVSAGELASALQRELLLAPWAFAPPPSSEGVVAQGRSQAGARPEGNYARSLRTGDWSFFSERWRSWRNNALDPAIVAGIYLASGNPDSGYRVFAWDGSTFSIERDSTAAAQATAALAIAGPGDRRMGLTRVGTEEWDLERIPGEVDLFILLRYDLGELAGTILPRLANLHLDAMADYRFRIIARDSGLVLYRSAGAEGDSGFEQADLRLGLFRQDFVSPDAGGRNPSASNLQANPPVFFIRSGNFTVAGPGQGAAGRARASFDQREDDALWILEAVHRDGSLAKVVRSSMIRSGIASSGILLLLGAALIVLALSQRRAGRLAARQEEFIASVTHELKTPLTVIGSAASNITDGIVSDRAGLERYGSTIGAETRRLVAMIDKLLLYTRLGSGKAAARDTVDLSSLARSVLAEREREFADLKFRVEHSLPETPLLVWGDEAALRHALQNLVSNVIVHAAEGAYLGVFAKEETRGRGKGRKAVIVLRVDDRGPGIPRRERKAIFEAFYRGRRARENQEPGSGIGLNLVRRVVLAHGGSVELESTEGFGTSVALILPAAAHGGA